MELLDLREELAGLVLELGVDFSGVPDRWITEGFGQGGGELARIA